MRGDPSEAVAFLTSWLPTGPWTVVADRESAGGRGDWLVGQFVRGEEAALAAFVAAHDGLDNLYFPVNLVRRGLTTSPREADVTHLLAVPLDVDLPAGAATGVFEAKLAEVRGAEPPPTVIVASGGGLQAHWLFDVPQPLAGASAVAAQVIALADALGGDHVQNVNRLMRLPGTVNVLNSVKRARGREPAVARIVEADWSRRYPLAARPRPAPPPLRSVDELTPEWRERVGTGSTAWLTGADRSRSAAVWRVIHHLLELGWPERSIVALITDPTFGISAHCLHQRHPERYAQRQVRNARTAAAQDYVRNRARQVIASRMDNVERAIAALNVSLQYDEFSGEISWVNGEDRAAVRLDDHGLARLRRDILRAADFQPAKDVLWDTAIVLARESTWNPIKDYLEPLVHDGQPRLETWLIEHGGAPDNAYVRAVSRIILVAAVTRVYNPGAEFHEMLVLENPTQGAEKSNAIRALCPDHRWFTDSLVLNASSKESIEALAGKWIVEISELSGMKQRDVEVLKAFLSRETDRARLAYDRTVTERPRTCVLFGTTNSTRYLRDEQNRRIWPVSVGRMNVQALLVARDQLWAEALLAYRAGASIRLHPSLWELASVAQEDRRLHDPWLLDLTDLLGDLTGKLLVTDVFRLLGLDRNASLRTQEANSRVGNAMRELGWEHRQARDGKRVRWFYVRGETETERRQPIYVLRDPVTNEVSVGHSPPDADLDDPPL